MEVSKQGTCITCLAVYGFRTHKDISSLPSNGLAYQGGMYQGGMSPVPTAVLLQAGPTFLAHLLPLSLASIPKPPP